MFWVLCACPRADPIAAPTWSDHIAIDMTILINNAALSAPQLLATDADTRACQPHASVRNIGDLFKRQSSTGSLVASAKRVDPPEADGAKDNTLPSSPPLKRSHSDTNEAVVAAAPVDVMAKTERKEKGPLDAFFVPAATVSSSAAVVGATPPAPLPVTTPKETRKRVDPFAAMFAAARSKQ